MLVLYSALRVFLWVVRFFALRKKQNTADSSWLLQSCAPRSHMDCIAAARGAIVCFWFDLVELPRCCTCDGDQRDKQKKKDHVLLGFANLCKPLSQIHVFGGLIISAKKQLLLSETQFKFFVVCLIQKWNTFRSIKRIASFFTFRYHDTFKKYTASANNTYHDSRICETS